MIIDMNGLGEVDAAGSATVVKNNIAGGNLVNFDNDFSQLCAKGAGSVAGKDVSVRILKHNSSYG
jgi:hypothetical protein